MSWEHADPGAKEEGPLIGKCFNIHIDINGHTRSQAIEVLIQTTRAIRDGLTNASGHPTSDQEKWEEAFPETFVSCGWHKHEPEYDNKEFEEYKNTKA